MTLLRLDEVALDFGDQTIFKDASFAIERGERVCLVGRNGAGKTTLFRLITGEQTVDSGALQLSPDLTVAQLKQTLPEQSDMSVPDYVATGLSEIRTWRARYEELAGNAGDPATLIELEHLQRRLDSADGWHLEQRVASFVTEMELPAERQLSELSGGWRRRVALARALIRQPDLLLLDEPTNHLDIVTIRWLEHAIRNYSGAVLFVTHDRAFVQTLATRIVELDRGKLQSWPGDYANFLRRREDALAAEKKEHERFDKKLAEEEVWIRQGIKARRSRNEGRVRALAAMREEREGRIKAPRSANMHIDEAEDSGRKVIRVHNVGHAYDGNTLFQNLSLKVMRGARIGLVGNNGVGKSTLLNIMLGNLAPTEGTVKHGTNLHIGYYDPLRQDLELDKSVAYNVGEGRDYIDINGKQHHIVGYLKGFLFSTKRAMTPVKALSGGERNRVLLARLFTRSSNLLVLDEPTNDLDVETLEVLEQKLTDYAGTLIVVSHDRQFLDNVVSSVLVFERDAGVREYVGNFSDWQRRGLDLAEIDRPQRLKKQAAAAAAALRRKNAPPTKLSYKEQRELDGLPEKIEALEVDIACAEAIVTAPDFYEQGFEITRPALDALEKIRHDLDAASERWLALEEKRESLSKD
ncbi:MAG: ATP-binding cassette domain-containing protein [Gammaproteobacteria bacterium]